METFEQNKGENRIQSFVVGIIYEADNQSQKCQIDSRLKEIKIN